MTPQDIKTNYVADLYGEVLLSEQDGAGPLRKPGLREFMPGLIVVGIGAASMQAAAASDRRFSIATTTPELVDSIRRRAATLNLDQQLVSIRLTAGDPAILTADAARLEAALADAVQLAINVDGAQAVIIGGGPLARAARALAPQFNVPIIEPIPAAVQAMVQTLMG